MEIMVFLLKLWYFYENYGFFCFFTFFIFLFFLFFFIFFYFFYFVGKNQGACIRIFSQILILLVCHQLSIG
jgi:hypothetical protein